MNGERSRPAQMAHGLPYEEFAGEDRNDRTGR
jgi:hypothetical protein